MTIEPVVTINRRCSGAFDVFVNGEKVGLAVQRKLWPHTVTYVRPAPIRWALSLGRGFDPLFFTTARELLDRCRPVYGGC